MYSQTWEKIMFSFENINIDQYFAEVSHVHNMVQKCKIIKPMSGFKWQPQILIKNYSIMKKLNVSQMENLQGNGPGRNCALMGLATLFAGAIGLSGGPGGAASGVMAGVMGGISMGCF